MDKHNMIIEVNRGTSNNPLWEEVSLIQRYLTPPVIQRILYGSTLEKQQVSVNIFQFLEMLPMTRDCVEFRLRERGTYHA